MGLEYESELERVEDSGIVEGICVMNSYTGKCIKIRTLYTNICTKIQANVCVQRT